MNNIIEKVIKVQNNEVRWLWREIQYVPLTPCLSASPGLVCMKSSSSVVELVMLLCSQASIYLHLPTTLCSSADLIYQVHLECSKSERIVSQPTPYLCSALPCLHFRIRSVPWRAEGNRREGVSGSKYWFEGQGWSTCLHHLWPKHWPLWPGQNWWGGIM